ncbi:MAG TPA: hypothetical protein VIV40_22220 [Kofleriaceae bacterium]
MRYTLLLVVLAGCLIEYGDDKPVPLTTAERAWLDDALPAMQAQCIVCHSGTAESPGFLAGDTAWEIRDTLLQSGVVDVVAPERSRLLSKGAHYGPAMTASQAADILGWLQAERDEQH